MTKLLQLCALDLQSAFEVVSLKTGPELPTSQ